MDRDSLAAVSPKDGGLGREDKGHTPDTVRRRCTDVPCLGIFLLGTAALCFILVHAGLNGNLEKETSLMEDTVDPCGSRSNIDEPYLYFCPNSGDKAASSVTPRLNTTTHVCISECPESSETTRNCGYGEIPDYPTVKFIGLICRPLDKNMTEELKVWFRNTPEAREVIRMRTIRNAWIPLLASALNAVLCSMLYIAFLWNCASFLVWTIFIALTVAPLCSGTYFLYCWKVGGCTECPFGLNDGTLRDLGAGVALVTLGLIFLCTACNRGKSIDLAVDCLEAACECVMETRSLTFVPLFALMCRVTLLSVMSTGGLMLSSLNQASPTNTEFVPIVGTEQAGFSPTETAFLALFGVMFYWMFHLIGAFTDFVTIYLTELWFFHGCLGDGGSFPRCSIWRAYWAGFRYHLGSLAMGAFAIGITSPLRHTIGVIAEHSRTNHNPIGLLLGAVCCFCISCFEECLAPVCKNAYMDLCMNAKPFCRSAEHALEIVRSEEKAVRILNGVTWLLQFCGLLCIGIMGHTLSLVIIVNSKTYTNPRSADFVYNQALVCVIATLISTLVCLPFMMIFDTVSDTIIYCYTVRKLRTAASGMPESDYLFGRYCGAVNGLPCMRQRSPASLKDMVDYPDDASVASFDTQGTDATVQDGRTDRGANKSWSWFFFGAE